ncbi:unnamed protein product [Peronospora farinosa]|uniref:Wings apart-like protein C-terminal domain-containing protein n=1 Tax=Peronospora farinosa TaxID=134698 RepID=A0ABN8CKH4_9STRA|nr:unnamed protein product [Peronospora farinosa]
MAHPSPRCFIASQAVPSLLSPRTYSLNADASNEPTLTSSIGLDPLQSRLEAVDRDSVRRKFAFYGRQHAHVDHLSGTSQVKTITLQSSVLLQEDGKLTTKLDDIMYLLDGLLGPVKKTQNGRLAQSCNILELIYLLQDQQMIQAMELANVRRQIPLKIKELILTKLGPNSETEDEAFRLFLAVLVYVLARSSSADKYFNHKVLDAVITVLKQEVIREETKKDEKLLEDVKEMKANVFESTRQIHGLEKKCLKRKSLCQQKGNVMDAAEVKVAGAFSCANRASVMSSRQATSTVEMLAESCWIKLDELLRDHEVFHVEGKLHVSVVSVLSAALHILLQVDGHSSFSSDLAQRYQREGNAQADDAAEETFRLIQTRKSQLVRNGGIDVLVRGLVHRLDGLEAILPLMTTKAITLECAHLLNSVSMLLAVFDQVTFLTLDVQRYISKKKDLFALLLKLIQLLSELSWGVHAPERWETELMRMSLAVEVLLSALRVLINLTHHNLEAASHVFSLDGMQLLPASFFQLQSLVATTAKLPIISSVTNKWEFDACLLLLSVMVNSIEFSEENRDALASASLCQLESAPDAFDLFTRFFLAKLQSYKHLVDLTETQGTSGAILIDDQGDDWNPEDVILGGCTSLLLGYLMKGSPANCTTILNLMPDCSPRLLLRALSVFAAFHSQIDALTPEVAKSVLHVEEILKSCQGNKRDSHQRGLLTGVAAQAYSNAIEWQHDPPMLLDSTAAAKSKEGCINLSSSVVLEKSVECESSGMLPPSLRVRSLKNVCSNLDDSDEDCEPHRQGRGNVVGTKAAQAISKNPEAIGINAPTHTPPKTPWRKRTRAELFVEASPALESNTRSADRSPLTAVHPDDSKSSSPVVARLLKRTRELVEEFDVEFATLDCSMREKNDEYSKRRVNSAQSPSMMLTMNVICRNDGSDEFDLSPDVCAENCNVIDTNKIADKPGVRARASSKRKMKAPRKFDGIAKSAVACKRSSFEFVLADTLSSTPQRTQTSKALLQTPTKDRSSPGFYRSSPLLNLTPTKTTPSMPLRSNKTTRLVRTQLKSDRSPILYQSPLSVSPHRRKAKIACAPSSARSSSIFDFSA